MSAVRMQSKTFWWYKYEGISPMRHLQVWAAFWPRLRWDCPPNIKRFIVENHSYVAKPTIPRLDRETLAVTDLGHLANLSIQHLLVCFVSPEFGQVFTLGSTPIHPFQTPWLSCYHRWHHHPSSQHVFVFQLHLVLLAVGCSCYCPCSYCPCCCHC